MTLKHKAGMGKFRLWLVACCVTLVAGCASVNLEERYGQVDLSTALQAGYYSVDIASHDGKILRATVYQPALAPGETAPLIIHTHGFGAFRAPRPFSIYGQLVLSGQAALSAWRSGYWVISYDQRGFGDSEGLVHLMDPDYEVRDFISVLDWAEKHLPRISHGRSGDPDVGAVGESYGGAVQILASMRDPRLDAIVPIATWYDLEKALAPNGVIQSIWPDLLEFLGTVGSGFDFDLIDEDRYQAALSGFIDEPVSVDLSRRSPAEYCEKGEPIQADALFIQGLRDVLFPLNQGLANWRCARKAGRDARLVAIQDGHILPWPVQSWSGMPLFNTQERVSCGRHELSAVAMVQAFWDEKLKGQAPARAWPPLCLTVSGGEGLALKKMPMEHRIFPVPDTSVKLAFSGSLELLLHPWDVLRGWLTPAPEVLPAHAQAVTGGTLRPAFIPLYRAEAGDWLVGIPHLRLDVHIPAREAAAGEEAGSLFAALGVRHPGSPAVDIIHEQFTPMIIPADREVTMPAVVYPLNANDTLGLVLQGFTGAYYDRIEGWGDSAHVSGAVSLPLD